MQDAPPDHGRERFPFAYGGSTELIPFAYPAPVAYGGNYINGPVEDGTPQPPTPPADASDHDRRQVAANEDTPRYRPLYQGPSTIAPVLPQPATTLIFRDGRPPQQVHNYALTVTTLYALDGDTRQEIPLSALNVPATVDANHAAGVEFALPVRRD